MRKSLLFIAGLVVAGSMNAQNCIPDYNPNATQLGFDPNPIQGSVAGVPYDEVVTIVLPQKVDNTLTPTPGDSIPLCNIEILSVSGIPTGYNYEVWGTVLGSGAPYNVLALSTDTIPVNPNSNFTRGCLRLTNPNPPAPTVDPLIDSVSITVEIAAWSDIGFGCVSLQAAGGTETFEVKLPVKSSVFASVENELNNNTFDVYSNYPNPAQQSTNVSFSTPVSGDVNIVMIDALGRQVYNQNMTSKTGLNTVNINTANFKSGVYMYTIQFNGKSVTKKMIVNK